MHASNPCVYRANGPGHEWGLGVRDPVWCALLSPAAPCPLPAFRPSLHPRFLHLPTPDLPSSPRG